MYLVQSLLPLRDNGGRPFSRQLFRDVEQRLTDAFERSESLQNVKTRRTSQGGWSQNRYQRHTANFHLLHVKEAIDMLDRVVREEGVPKIFLSGDEVVLPIVREQLSKELADKVIDFNNLDTGSADTEVLRATLERLREHDAQDDRERVTRLLDEYRAGGLAVVGADATRAALEMGQVDELLVSAVMDRAGVPGSGAPETLQPTPAAGIPAAEPLPSNVVRAVAETAGANEGGVTAVVSTAAVAEPIPDVERAAEEFVTKATQTGAKVTFIEDPALLADVGGVGALLRFRI